MANFLTGDFFGDGFSDVVLLLEDTTGSVKLAIIDYGEKKTLHLLGMADDPFDFQDYSWMGVFRKAPAGDTLWANYVDGYRDFEEVPVEEKVVLDYDALYGHLTDACGGGFIYWQNGKFNWL